MVRRWSIGQGADRANAMARHNRGISHAHKGNSERELGHGAAGKTGNKNGHIL